MALSKNILRFCIKKISKISKLLFKCLFKKRINYHDPMFHYFVLSSTKSEIFRQKARHSAYSRALLMTDVLAMINRQKFSKSFTFRNTTAKLFCNTSEEIFWYGNEDCLWKNDKVELYIINLKKKEKILYGVKSKFIFDWRIIGRYGRYWKKNVDG